MLSKKPSQNTKKKPPPRPPPPNFTKFKSKSSFNLNQQQLESCLIEWSPPSSPKVERNRPFGGSVSSSFSSSTSSLASSKKSLEYETLPITGPNAWPSSQTGAFQTTTTKQSNLPPVPSLFGPTIIRAQQKKIRTRVDPSKDSLPPSPPMPTIPPPSPPKIKGEVETPYGIALYDYPASDPSDLPLQVNDVVILIRRVNNEWLYGRVIDKEGIFPANFIEIKVPLVQDERTVTALYDFRPQEVGDLQLKAGQTVCVIRKISEDWLYGEANGRQGQFPSNFVDRIPKSL